MMEARNRGVAEHLSCGRMTLGNANIYVDVTLDKK